MSVTTGCVQSGGPGATTEESNRDSSMNASTDHTVSVTKRVESQSGLKQSIRATNGELHYVLTCPNGSQKTVSGSITNVEWMTFKQEIVSLDLDDIKKKYECVSRCPQDIPSKQILVTVDGSTVSTVIEASASIPTELGKVTSTLSAFEKEIKKPTCK